MKFLGGPPAKRVLLLVSIYMRTILIRADAFPQTVLNVNDGNFLFGKKILREFHVQFLCKQELPLN